MIKKIIIKLLKKIRWRICKTIIYERERRPRQFEGCFPIKIIENGKVIDEFWADYMTIKGDDTIELNKKIINRNHNAKDKD